MKLEPNMYVRTKTGIKQIYSIDNNKTKYKYLYKLKKQDGDGCIDCGALSSEDILKASHTLLGNDKEPCLIEPGDYVNGYRVTEIETLPTKQKLVVVGYGYDADEISEKNIETIVTKEQFESMEYKL